MFFIKRASATRTRVGTGGEIEQEAAHALRLWAPATDVHSSATSHSSVWIKR